MHLKIIGIKSYQSLDCGNKAHAFYPGSRFSCDEDKQKRSDEVLSNAKKTIGNLFETFFRKIIFSWTYKLCILPPLKRNNIVMSTVTVNISFQDSLLNEIDKTARKEYRSRSELIREAARLYIQRQSQWTDLFQLGDMTVQKQHLTEHDVTAEIKAVREAKTKVS